MKQTGFFILLIAAFAVMASAQGRGRDFSQEANPGSERSVDHRARRGGPVVERVTVSGGLVVAHGSPAVKSGDDTYLVRGLTRLVGFIDGLKEGAQVTIEGRAISRAPDSTLKALRPSKLTLDGKTYDMTSPAGNFRPKDFQRQPVPPRSYKQPMPPVPQGRPRQQFNRPNEQWRQGRPRTL